VRLTEDQEDALREIINIGIGRAAATLSELIGTRIEMTVPRVSLRMLEKSELQATSPDGPDVVIVQDFRGDLLGRSALVLPHASGLRLARLLGDVAEPVDELDLEMSGILTEVGNIMLNSVLGAMANIVGARLVYSVPYLYTDRPVNMLLSPTTQGPRALLMADAEFWVRDDVIRGSLLIVMETLGLVAILATIFEVEA
jgi:chemotaxis protein CheC